jgi:hypothetical protein
MAGLVPAIHVLLAAKTDPRGPSRAAARQQIQLWENAPFLPDQRHAVKEYIQVPAPRLFRCYPVAMHRLGPSAAVVLIAALDASWPAAAECTCRAPGRQVELGQTACLMTPKGLRLATCGMALNNTSWQFSQTPCTVSDAGPSGGGQVAQFAGK